MWQFKGCINKKKEEQGLTRMLFKGAAEQTEIFVITNVTLFSCIPRRDNNYGRKNRLMRSYIHHDIVDSYSPCNQTGFFQFEEPKTRPVFLIFIKVDLGKVLLGIHIYKHTNITSQKMN